MKKITISTSLALILASSIIASEEMKAIEVVSIATKTQKSIDGVAASVEVVTQKEIEKMGASSLKDIIEKTPGLTMQYGTFPSSSSLSKSSISIRGMGVNGTLFLLDGRRLSGEVKNPYDLERIPASLIERIEIVKGPNSSLYGADAVGGVINIITKKPKDDMKIDVNARYGSNGDGEAQALNLSSSIQGKDNALSYSLYAGMTTTDPYKQKEIADTYAKTSNGNVKPSSHPNPQIKNVKDSYLNDTTYREDNTIYTVGTRLSYDFTSDIIAGIDVNYFKEERDGVYIGYIHPAKTSTGGVPIYNAPVNSHDENNRLDLSADIEYVINDDLFLKARIYNSTYEKRNDTTAKYYTDFNYPNEQASKNAAMNADVDITVYEASATYAVDTHFITTGLEYRNENRKSSVFNNNVSMSEKEVEYKSVFVQDEYELNDKFNTIFGARYEDISNAENKSTFRIGGVYSFNDMAKVRANFAQGFRTPDIREMYINMNTPNGPQRGAEVMDYNLKPEATDAYEIGLKGRNGEFSYDAVIFYNDIENKIESIKNSAGVTTFENIGKAETYGSELSLNYQILNNLNSTFFWTELKTKNKDTKKDLEFNPDRTFMLSFDYQATSSLNIGLVTKYIGKQNYTKITNRGTPTQSANPNATTDAFSLADVSFNYKIDNTFDIYGGVNNIVDTSVEDILGSSVGRYYFTGIRGHF
ncbi:MAG: TonB-dependent receptor [Campylobacterota bacterium]|nr:TonB-dependent receptor [Campylobacterota bacterium]